MKYEQMHELMRLRAEVEKIDVIRRNRDRLAIQNGILREQCDRLLDALREIALAGMSCPSCMSEEETRSWHARRAFEFIGIAARALKRSTAA